MTPRFNMIIQDELLNRIKSLAEQEDISVSALVKRLMQQYVDGCDYVALEKRVAELERKLQNIGDEKNG